MLGSNARGGWRRIWFALASMVLAIGAVAAVGELACRLLWPDQRLRYEPDPVALFRLEPEQTGRLLLANNEPTPVIHLDSHGFRGRAPDSPPARSLFVLGDSFAFGQGVADEEVFASRIDAALGSDVHVWNGAQPGYGVYQMQAMLEREGAALRPDRVLLVLWQGDFVRQPLPPEEHEAFLRRSRVFNLLKSSLLVTHGYRAFEGAARRFGQDSVILRVGEVLRVGEDEGVIETHMRGLQEDLPRILAMHRRAAAIGEGLVLVLWPKEDFASQAEPGLAQRLTATLERFGKANGIPFVSLQSTMARAPAEQLLIEGDGHPTAFAHCLAAERILEVLSELGEERAERIRCSPPAS